MKEARKGVVALILTSLFVGGCGEDDRSGEANTPSWSDQLDDLAEVATEQGSSEDQIRNLEEGNVDFETYQASVQRTFDCIESAGIHVIGKNVTEERGYPRINYSYAANSEGRSASETDALTQECITQHSKFIEAAYNDSPKVQEVLDQHFESYRVSVLECLAEQGMDVDEDASRTEIQRVNVDLMTTKSVDCVSESGYRNR